MLKTQLTPKQKQRVTAFIDPALYTRIKVRAALEDITISEVFEKALDEYAPKIVADEYSHIKLTFDNGPIPKAIFSTVSLLGKKNIPKHTKSLNVPRR